MIRDAKSKKGQVIYRQNEEAGEVFFVKFGTVHLYFDYKTADSKLIGIVGEGRVFGELGVIEDKPRTMTSVAAEDTVVTIVDKESFPSYLKEHPNKLLVVMESISSRIIAQSNKLAKACKVCAEYSEEKETKGYVDSALMNEMRVLAAENKKARH